MKIAGKMMRRQNVIDSQEKYILLTIIQPAAKKASGKQKDEDAARREERIREREEDRAFPIQAKRPLKWLLKVSAIESVFEYDDNPDVTPYSKVLFNHHETLFVKETVEEITGMIQNMHICPGVVINAKEI